MLVTKSSQSGVGHASLFDMPSCTRLQTLQHTEYAYSRGDYDDNSPFEWSPDKVKLAVHYTSSTTCLVVGCLTRQTCSERKVSRSAASCEVQLHPVKFCAAGILLHCSPGIHSVPSTAQVGIALGASTPVVCSLRGPLGPMG